MDGELLISEVFARPAIWQSKNKHHRNRGVIDRMWEEIGKALDSTKDDARNKWRNMRDHYRKELRKVVKCTSGDAGGKFQKSSWPFFELMYFLKDEMSPSVTSGNLQLSDNELNPNDVEDSVEESQQLEERGNEDAGEYLSNDRTDTPTMSRHSSSMGSSQYSRKRKESVQDVVAKKMLRLEEQKVELLRGDTNVQCEDYHFLMSLLPHFKEISQTDKLTVRNKINQVIIDAKKSNQKSISQAQQNFETFNYLPDEPHTSRYEFNNERQQWQ